MYQNNDGCLEVLKICDGELCKDICVKFMHDNKHSIGNHYEPMVREVGNQEMKQNVEVKIENEETSNEEEQKYQPSIEDEPSIVPEAGIEDEPSMIGGASIKDEPSMIGEASIEDEPPMVWDIPTPTSYDRNYEDEDASILTEQECPLDLTMKHKKQPSKTQHIPLPTGRRKTV